MKTITPRALVVAFFGAAWLLVAAPAAAAESLSLLLQKAIYVEETEGNLDSAIKLYEQIAAEAATNRALAAQAQYRLAVCYQKQGKKELAISALGELQKQLPSDHALGHKVRELLIALGQMPADTLTLRKVSLVNTSWIRDVSEDGRWVAYTGDNGEIYLRETSTGTARMFVKCTWDNYPWSLVFAPDSRRVVYDTFGTSLVIANVDGTGVREIFKAKDKESISPAAWLAKTRQIIAMVEEGMPKRKSFVSVDPESGAVRRFNTPPLTGRFGVPSQDGRFVAMVDTNRLSIVSLETGREEVIAESDAPWPLGWAYDDSVFFFLSDRTGGRALCSVPIHAGKATGEPVLIKEYARDVYLVTAKPDGRIYYAEDNRTANVAILSANLETGEITSPPRPMTDRFLGTQTSPVWSRDGRRLWIAVYGEQRRFVAVSTKTGKEEDFPFINDFLRMRSYSLSPDGGFAVVEGSRMLKEGNSVNGLHRFEFATGKVETLATSRSRDWYRRPQVSPDGKSLVVFRGRSSGEGEQQVTTNSFVRRDLVTGEEKVVHQMTGDRNLAWPFAPAFSPDGSLLAFTVTDHVRSPDYTISIHLLNLHDGQMREVTRLAPAESVNSIEWTPDGRRLVYAKNMPSKEGIEWGHTEVWSFAIHSGQHVKLALPLQNIAEVSLHPDGRQLAVRTGGEGSGAQLWVMHGSQLERLARTSGAPRPKPIARSANALLKSEELIDANNLIQDRETGVTAMLPAGWKLKRASRSLRSDVRPPNVWPEGLTGLELDWPGKSIVARLNYHIYENPRPLGRPAVEKWLRDFTSQVVASRSNGMPDFKIDPGSFVFRTVGGNPALSWVADFTWFRSDKRGKEYGTVIRGDNGHAFVWVEAHPTEFEAVRDAMESMVESVRLP